MPNPAQGTLPLGPANLRQFDPVERARQGAAQFTRGAHSIEGLEHAHVDPIRSFQIQSEYKQALAAPTEKPGIRQSYEAMRQGINDQYAFMTRPREEGGMGMKHEIHETEPYGFHWADGNDANAAQEMSKDVAGGRIKTLATKSTGEHSIFSNEENDKFRAVHDVFGHAATGRGFSRHGEEAAYLSHRQMFSKKAIPALASETRGQNSYLNYGPGTFPEQETKLIGLPKIATQIRNPR
jgi:hypothetical protein